MSLFSTISNIGFVNDVVVSSDGSRLFLGSSDSCSQSGNCTVPALDGGLYTYALSGKATPSFLSHVQFPAAGYSWTSYNSLVYLPDINLIYVASAEQEFQVISVSDLAVPELISRLPTSCQAIAVTLFPESSNALVSNSCDQLLKISYSSSESIALEAILDVGAQTYTLSFSPNGTQVALGSQSQAAVIQVSGSSLGNPIDISSIVPQPRALAYIDNQKALIVSQDVIAVVDLSVPSSPVVVGQVQTGSSIQGMAGVVYRPSSKIAYVAIGNVVNLVDLSDQTKPAIRGSLHIDSQAIAKTGLAVTPDGNTLYISVNGQVSIVRVGP